jgi:hypothetical protein
MPSQVFFLPDTKQMLYGCSLTFFPKLQFSFLLPICVVNYGEELQYNRMLRLFQVLPNTIKLSPWKDLVKSAQQ